MGTRYPTGTGSGNARKFQTGMGAILVIGSGGGRPYTRPRPYPLPSLDMDCHVPVQSSKIFVHFGVQALMVLLLSPEGLLLGMNRPHIYSTLVHLTQQFGLDTCVACQIPLQLIHNIRIITWTWHVRARWSPCGASPMV